MTSDESELIPVFIPSLSATLVSAEDKKGEPLSYDEVIRIRDGAPCIMMEKADARKLAESRQYTDIDPENCWYEWQMLRRELGRKPEIDPGPKFGQIRSADPDYQRTIQLARESLGQFRAMLPKDGTPRFGAMVKLEVADGKERAYLWLANARLKGDHFVAELFEVPASFKRHTVGDQVEVESHMLLDWMVNDEGVLHGGYSLRYQRSRLPEEDQAAFDKHIGITTYA